MLLKAELDDLGGKYYGSRIKITDQANHVAYIEVWVNTVTDYKPSERELKGHVEQLLADGFTDAEIRSRSDLEYEVSDDHYETQGAYRICNAIVEALNGLEV